MKELRRITVPAATAIRLELRRGEILRIEDLEGGQVADLFAITPGERCEWLSSGRSLDYNGTLFLTTGSVLYSNHSTPLFWILSDTAGRHDFLHAACSQEMFELQYGVRESHPNCLENLARCLAPDGLDIDRIGTPFNVFMRVDVSASTGELHIRPPSSRAGDYVELLAQCDLVVALAACAAEKTNQGRLKPIGATILAGGPEEHSGLQQRRAGMT